MDLGAYVQIEDLSEIANKNGIKVPRLRGYRLMKDEAPVTQEEINNMIKDAEINAVECLIESIPSWKWSSNTYRLNLKNNRFKKYYLISSKSDGYKRFVGIRWDRIHGRKRKELKFAIKQCRQEVLAQWNTWNKYAGKEDVLYIYARIGGWNWHYWGGEELEKQPWFLEKVDNHFDSTYCDIYARIQVEETNKITGAN